MPGSSKPSSRYGLSAMIVTITNALRFPSDKRGKLCHETHLPLTLTNWLDCELIYLERFAQKLQRTLDRKVIGF
jgi:hypothetical protein